MIIVIMFFIALVAIIANVIFSEVFPKWTKMLLILIAIASAGYGLYISGLLIYTLLTA